MGKYIKFWKNGVIKFVNLMEGKLGVNNPERIMKSFSFNFSCWKINFKCSQKVMHELKFWYDCDV